MEPEKPFACTLPDCGMTFTNEDHLHVHTKKHDMVLQLGLEQKAAFVADQTPTPTRFIRNCEEVGLFQDLQNVNPFDEGFKRAMETKHSNLPLEGDASSADDVLHTPHMMFPMMDPGDCSLYSTTNNHRNITISRSSSDESGAVKEYETTTISKLTNEVTTISRVVGKPDVLDRVTTTDDVSIVRHEETARNKDGINETSVSYTKIHSNVEIRKDNVNIESKAPVPIAMMSYSDAAIKDATVTKDVLVADGTRLQVPEKIPPMMSQKSLDYVVDSLATECRETVDTAKTLKRNYSNVIKADVNQKHIEENAKGDEDYEVIIKLPNGKQVRMKAVEETERTVQKDTKERLKKTIASKVDKIRKAQTASLPNPQIVTNVVPITGGTLIPVTIVNPIISTSVPKIPILPFSHTKNNYKTVRRKVGKKLSGDNPDSTVGDGSELSEEGVVVLDDDEDAQRKKTGPMSSTDSRSAASKRYRERLKESMRRQSEENKHLRELSQRLISEKAVLKLIITEHLKKCPIGDDLRTIQESLQKISQ